MTYLAKAGFRFTKESMFSSSDKRGFMSVRAPVRSCYTFNYNIRRFEASRRSQLQTVHA